MMVFPLLLIFFNVWSVSCLRSIPPSTFKINALSSGKPAYVTKLEESTEKLELKQDEFSEELRNVSSRVDDLSGRFETTQTSCTCKQEEEQTAAGNEKALALLEEKIAELKEALLIQEDTNAAKSRNYSDAVRRLEEMVHSVSTKSLEAENKIRNLAEFANRVLYKLTAFIGTWDHADSNDQISLRIDGSSETYTIQDINDQRRDKGQENEVFFHSAPLGSIDSVYMELHGTDGWYIDKLTIDELYTGQIFTFDFGGWVDDDPIEELTARLSLTSTYTHNST